MSQSTTDNPATITRTVGSILAGSIGNVVEWYDWSAYALMVAVFAPQIFPSGTEIGSVIEALIAYAIGFLVRPLGSLVLSPYGDKVGRRKLLSLTIVLMGAGSLLLAVTPSYRSIGIASPIVFLIARVVQGFSAGGEFQGSSTYLVEQAPPARRGLIGSLQLVSITIAIVGASAVGTLTTGLIPAAALAQWGWRIPFIFGALIAAYGFYVRLRAPETPAFEAVEAKKEIDRNPLSSLIRLHWRSCLWVVTIQITTVPYYMWSAFLPTYAHLTAGLPLSSGLLGETIGLLLFMGFLVVVGHLSDRWGRKPFLFLTAIGFIVLAYPLFLFLQHATFWTFLAVEIAGLLLMSGVDGVMASTMCEIFPTRVRASGIGIPYALTAAVFSGTAPLIATSFIERGQPMGIAFYVIAICIVAGIGYLTMPETYRRDLTRIRSGGRETADEL
ncbi:MAG: MFS transporter [Candidatus Dormibacteraceae bacterium]